MMINHGLRVYILTTKRFGREPCPFLDFTCEPYFFSFFSRHSRSLFVSFVFLFPYLFPRPAYKPHSVHAGCPAPMIISLGCELPHTSCSLPEAMGLAARVTGSHLRVGSPLLDLAPCGGCLAAGITACVGGLLHHLFTLTTSFTPLPNLQDLGEVGGGCGLSLWPYPSGCLHKYPAGGPVPGVTRHIALWSADFPQWHVATAVIQPAWDIHHTII